MSQKRRVTFPLTCAAQEVSGRSASATALVPKCGDSLPGSFATAYSSSSRSFRFVTEPGANGTTNAAERA